MPLYTARQPTPLFANNSISTSSTIPPRLGARQVRPAQTYVHSHNHAIATSSPAGRRGILSDYITKSSEHDPSVYPTEPAGIRELLPAGFILAYSGQRISLAGRVVNVTGDDGNPILMWWPYNEPLPNKYV